MVGVARIVYRIGEGEHGGDIIIGEAPVGGATGPSLAVEVAEEHANLPDNSAKLEGQTERAVRTCGALGRCPEETIRPSDHLERPHPLWS